MIFFRMITLAVSGEWIARRNKPAKDERPELAVMKKNVRC